MTKEMIIFQQNVMQQAKAVMLTLHTASEEALPCSGRWAGEGGNAFHASLALGESAWEQLFRTGQNALEGYQ